MMAGNPNRWSMNGMHPQLTNSQFINYVSNSSTTSVAAADDQDFPVRSWSQLLGGEEEKFGGSLFQQQKKLENWEDQLLNLNPSSFPRLINNNNNHVVDVKQEVSQQSSCQLYHDHDELIHPNKPSSSWPHHHQMMPVSSPNSCITSLSNNFLNFSGGNAAAEAKNHHHHQDHSSECNSTSSGGVPKKPRVQQSSPQPALKVRKEKLGDRITALHQLVSPFGKTDTASVLSEAIGYIRFLQGQIEALSSPYMRNGSLSTGHGHHTQHSVQERNCLFQEEGGQDSQSRVKDLRSRGLCLVPISCTQNVENDNGADYWAPATLGGGF
ncbi:hypothetical protein ACS0TY_012663 [Phlomoides rotata]